jgi:hypothetical protein
MKHLSDQRAPRKSKPVTTLNASPEDVANLILQELFEAYALQAQVTITLNADCTTHPATLNIEAETTHTVEGMSW